MDFLIRQLTRVDQIPEHMRSDRARGLDWPDKDGAETMVGLERLSNVETLAWQVLRDGVPGDFVECGTWRGGVGILMSRILLASPYNSAVRIVPRRLYIADSFEGCPVPDPRNFPADRNDPHHTFEFLKVPLDQVQRNFSIYGALGPHVAFLKGWFKDTLPGPIERIALLRVDSDLYESTTEALDALYSKLSPGGFVILDDYHNIPNCRMAIDDFRRRNGIQTPMTSVDWCAVYWQKQANEGRAAA